MRRIPAERFREYIPYAKMNTANRVYPLSIAEGCQSGDIFVNEGPEVNSVLFWHYCGFGYISGKASEGLLNEVYAEMLSAQSPRRLVLITDDKDIIRYFCDKDVSLIPRIEYSFPEQEYHAVTLDPDRFRIVPIGHDNIDKIRGRIIPSFSWDSDDRFLEKGYGYAAVTDDTVCAVAFSSAVSSEEVDIGVETLEDYRRQGLASALASQMVRHILRTGKKPVWAHGAANKGSRNTAQRCGFMEVKINTMIRRREG